MAKCPKCGADMVNDGDNLKCPNCNSTQIKESANAGQAKNGDEQQSELDLLKARLAELEKKQEKNDKVKTGSLSVKEKLAPVAVFFKKWGLKAVLPAALFLIAFITLLVCFCGLRGIYVNVDDPNEFYSFSPTSYEYHGTLFGEEYVDEGTWKTGGGMLSLTYEDEMFGKITDSYSFSHTGYDTVYITDSFGDKKEFKRVSILAYSTPQKVISTLDYQSEIRYQQNGVTVVQSSSTNRNEHSIGSKIKEPIEPIRRGYQFMGWYTTPDGWKTEGASQFDFDDRIWEDTTVYANWRSSTEYKLTGDMLPEEGVTFFEGDDLTQIYQSAGGVNEKIGNGSAVIEFKDKNGKIVSGAAPRSNVTATLKEVVIGDNVSSISDNAFSGCSSILSITIPASVTSIGTGAFADCDSLESITVDYGNIVYLSSGNCIIESETGKLVQGCNGSVIPTNGRVRSIGSYAFSGCDASLSITIPSSVTSIGEYAFKGCSSEIKWNNTQISEIGNNAFAGYLGEYITIPKSITKIGENAFSDCEAQIKWQNSPTIKNIGDYTFAGYKGESITIPDSVTNIGSNVFNGCTAEIRFGNSALLSIGEKAFADYKGKSIFIPSSVTSIGKGAFYGCSLLQNLTIPFVGETKDGLSNTHFGYIFGAIDYEENHNYIPSSLKNVTIIGNTNIKSNAFYNCYGLKSIVIGNDVTSIGSNAFDGCTAEIKWGNNPTIENIGSYVFSGYKGTSITIPDSVTSIGDYAFDGCTAEIKWGNNPTIETISSYAFSGYKGTSILIPNSVTSIVDDAFSGCESLETITVDSGNSVYHSAGNCLIETATKTLIAGCKNSVIPDDGSVTSIGDGAFA